MTSVFKVLPTDDGAQQAYDQGFADGQASVGWKWRKLDSPDAYGQILVASNLPDDQFAALGELIGRQIAETIAHHVELQKLIDQSGF